MSLLARPIEKGLSFVIAGLRADRRRWPLFAPVALGLGIGLYFSLPAEPPLWPGGVACALCGAGSVLSRSGAGRLLALAALLVAGGFWAGGLRAAAIRHDALAARTAAIEIDAKVVETDRRGTDRLRLVLADIHAAAPAVRVPARARISEAASGDGPQAGDRVHGPVVFLPLPGPVLPGGPDHGRQLWFEGLDALGFAPRPLAVAPGTRQGFLAALRGAIAARLAAILPGSDGAIAQALTVGERGAIPDETEDAWRRAGITHVLSISGLHISLAAGTVFLAVRLLVLFLPGRRHWPAKKIAALFAIAAAVFYTLLSGADVPADRSMIMTATLFLAVLVDRLAITLRVVAVAATLILLFLPESLLDVGFGMSFAAVVALVAAYEVLQGPTLRWRRRWGDGIVARISIGLCLLALSSAVATLATLPFGLHVFGRIGLYGIVTNMAVVPLTSILVMPAVVAGLALMPLGLDRWPIEIMGLGIRATDAIAHEVARWPGAGLAAAAMPQAPFLALVGGGLWLCLWRGAHRLAGLAALPAAAVLWVLAPAPPDLLVHGGGQAVALVGEDGLEAVDPPAPAFVIGQWRDRLGLDDVAQTRPPCAPGAVCRLDGGRLLIDRRRFGKPAGCAQIIVAPRRRLGQNPCGEGALLIDAGFLATYGSMALWWDGPAIWTEAAARGRRPWVPPGPDQ